LRAEDYPRFLKPVSFLFTMTQEEAQQKYMELQMIEQHLKELQEQLESLQQQEKSLAEVKHALSEYALVKENTPVFLSLAPGIYVKGKVEQTQEFIVNVGSDVMIKKDAAGIEELIGNQQRQMQEAKEKIHEMLEFLFMQATRYQSDLKELIEDV